PAGWDLARADGSAANDEEFPSLQVLADGRPRRAVRVHATRANGKRVIFDVTAVPLLHRPSCRLAGVATAFADVTRRVQLEAEAQLRVRSALAGHSEHFATTMRGADGRTATFDVHYVPARGVSGTVHGIYSIAFEVPPPR